MSPILQFTTARLHDCAGLAINGWPALWPGDRLSDDPPPVVPPDGCTVAGHGRRYVADEEPTIFVVLSGTAGCGHTVMRRIGFYENIKTFEHYGTVFEGSSYSIKNASARMTQAMQNDCLCVQWFTTACGYGLKGWKMCADRLRNICSVSSARWTLISTTGVTYCQSQIWTGGCMKHVLNAKPYDIN